MRQSGRSSDFPFAAKGATSRTACQSWRDATAPIVLHPQTIAAEPPASTCAVEARQQTLKPQRRDRRSSAGSSAPGARSRPAGRCAPGRRREKPGCPLRQRRRIGPPAGPLLGFRRGSV
jgi:hypothetical protein